MPIWKLWPRKDVISDEEEKSGMDYFEELKKISADMQEDVKEQIDEQSRSLVIIRKAFSD